MLITLFAGLILVVGIFKLGTLAAWSVVLAFALKLSSGTILLLVSLLAWKSLGR